MGASARILILSSGPLCRNPRVVKEATTLGNAGYDVTVASVSTYARFESTDLELMRGLPFQRRVLDFASPRPAARFANLMQRSRTWAARALCRRFGIESAQSLGPASAFLRLARSHPADLTIVHTEIPMWAAQTLLREGRRVAVDMEDWYSEDLLPADRRGRPQKLLRAAEEFVLCNASYASATSASMSAALVDAYRCPLPVIIRNTFPLQPRSRLDRGAREDVPTFIWFSQTIGPGRGLESFLAAWSQMKRPSRIYLLGDERRGYREQLLAPVPPERREAVRFLPVVSPQELPKRLAEFDIGLALEARSPKNRDVTITNKIFQYMNAGLALVATDTSGQKEVMCVAPDSGRLVQAEETARTATALDALVGDPARLRACQQAARAAAVEEFCWEKDSKQLLRAVERALVSPVS